MPPWSGTFPQILNDLSTLLGPSVTRAHAQHCQRLGIITQTSITTSQANSLSDQDPHIDLSLSYPSSFLHPLRLSLGLSVSQFSIRSQWQGLRPLHKDGFLNRLTGKSLWHYWIEPPKQNWKNVFNKNFIFAEKHQYDHHRINLKCIDLLCTYFMV